jgi:hypothetical protein
MGLHNQVVKIVVQIFYAVAKLNDFSFQIQFSF